MLPTSPARLSAASESPLPMQYLGSKQRISGWLLDEITGRFPGMGTFVDLMSGSGAVANEAIARGLRIVANDLQPYSHSILESMFVLDRSGLAGLIDRIVSAPTDDDELTRGRARFTELLVAEDAFKTERRAGRLDWKAYQQFCAVEVVTPEQDFDLFISYYANTYFGVRQCLEIDSLRRLSTSLDAATGKHLVAALISAMSHLSSSTTHLAQYLKPSSPSAADSLLARRSASVVDTVVARLRALAEYPRPDLAVVTNLRFQDALTQLDVDPAATVVYVDPPYFKEHYSRYYHVLDTLALYDYPALTLNPRLGGVSVGRYREGRLTSEFGLKSRAASAFRELIELCQVRGVSIAISYASTSLVSIETIVAAGEVAGYDVSVREIALRHSGQGMGGTNANVTEYLLLFGSQ